MNGMYVSDADRAGVNATLATPEKVAITQSADWLKACRDAAMQAAAEAIARKANGIVSLELHSAIIGPP